MKELPKITFHRLNIDPLVQPKQQLCHPLNSEKYEALNKEVQKLTPCS